MSIRRLKAEDVELIRRLYILDAPRRQQLEAINEEIKQLLNRVATLIDERKENRPISRCEISVELEVSEPSVRRAINKMKGRK